MKAMMTCCAAILAATLTPVLAADIPSCDLVIKRFVDAPHVLALKQLKPTTLYLNQVLIEIDKIHGKTPGWPDQVYHFHDDESDSDLNLECTKEKFSELHLSFYRGTSSWYRTTSKRPAPHPYLDYIASAIYAVTGWPADKVMKTAADAWKFKVGLPKPSCTARVCADPEIMRASDPEFYEAAVLQSAKYTRQTNLLPGLCATISWGGFTIWDCFERAIR